MYNNIDINIGLYGEYRLRIIEDNNIITDTGWCKNTILSSGLVSLSSMSIPDALSYVDLGISGALSGSQGYSLTGVHTKCNNTELINIERDSLQSYTKPQSTKVYVAGYTSEITTLSSEVIREYCVVTRDGKGFSRNVFPNEITVKYGQAVNFEYRLSLNWSSTYNVSVPFKTTAGGTFYVDTTTTTYNIPYDSVYYNNNKLLLLKNNESLPNFGDNYPVSLDYAFNNQYYSTFSPTTVVASINSNKTVSVYEEYKNISKVEVDENIVPVYTALIVKDGDIETRSSKFIATRFNYPIFLYNYSSISDLNILPINNTTPRLTNQYNCFKKNIMSLCYRYCWRETSGKPTGTSNLTLLPTLSVNCSTFDEVSCGDTITYVGNNSNNIYKYVLPTRKGPVSLTYETNGVPIKFKVVIDGITALESGFLGDVSYNGSLINYGFDTIEGPSTGILSFIKSTNSTSALVYVESPLYNVDYSFNLGCPL